jgi:hypothetical protein
MAKTLTQVGIETGNLVEAYHVTQSIDAFTGVDAYDISLSGSLNITGSLSQGSGTQASGVFSHAEGQSTQAIGDGSHAEGQSTQAIGEYSHAEGIETTAQGAYSHAEGDSTTAIGTSSHAEGASTTATGPYSHAEGSNTQAIGAYSHAEGLDTIASGSYQHVQGQFNLSSSAQSAFIIGNGTSDASRSNLVFASGSQFQVTGSVIATTGFTGSLQGTASFAVTASHVISASYAVTASHVISASYAVTASHVISASYAVTASHVISASYALSASHAPNFATTDLTFSGNRTHNTSGNTLTITDGTNDRFEILTTSTVFNDSGADIDFRVESLDNANALLVDAFTNQVRIGVTGSKSAPSLYFGSDNNTGFYNSGSNNILYITANSTDVARISPQQLIVGDQDFKSNINYAQSGVLTQGYLYSLEGLSSNIFYHPSNFFARGKANLGGFSITYVPTSSIVDPADGEKVIFRTMPSGSTTGSAVTSSAALRIDVNYIDGVDNEPNIEIVNRLTLGTTWFADGSGTELQRNGSGQIGVASSDTRLKTNIQTITGSLDIIKSLNGVRYNWTNENDPSFIINNPGSQIGLIAQEVEQILPEIVKFNGVKDYKTIDYDKIVAVLIEAIKEQQQQIDNLQQQIDSLKS